MTEYTIACKLQDGRAAFAAYFGSVASVGFSLSVTAARELAAQILAVADEIEREQAEQAARDAELRALAADEVAG